MGLIVFFIGFLSGLTTAMGLLLYLLSMNGVQRDKSVSMAYSQKSDMLPEDLPTDEDQKLLTEAVRNLRSLQTGVLSSPDEVSEETPHMTLYQLEQNFYELCNSSKERGKELTTFAPLLSDIGRTYAALSKDLAKLSLVSRSNIKSFHDTNLDIAGSDVEIVGNFYSDWWKALSLFLDHMSDDAARLAETISQDSASRIIQICEDHSIEDKKLTLEGTTLLTQLKDILRNNEPLLQERDKWRLKVSTALIVPTGVPIIGGMTLVQSEEESRRRVLKLQVCELTLLQNTNKIADYKSEFRMLMPNVLRNFKALSSISFARAKSQLCSLGDNFKKYKEDSIGTIQRFTSHISVTESSGTIAGVKRTILIGFEPMLQRTLEALNSEVEKKKNLNFFAVNSLLSIVDMSLESTACLAATAPTVLPPLPPFFQNTIGFETCVWFNAFSGRVYRDAARSAYFHSWLKGTLTKNLNKGKRPGFVDEFLVESVVFGSTPPLLFNIQWIPPTVRSTAKKGRILETSQSFKDNKTNYVPESMSTKSVPEFHSCETSYHSSRNNNVDGHCTSTSNTRGLCDDLHVCKECLESIATSGVPDPRSRIFCNTNKSDNVYYNHYSNSAGDNRSNHIDGINYSNGKTHHNTGKSDSSSVASDDDIECTADMTFKSGMKFKVSTRLCCNWPSDRYASIPVTLTLELVEISGKIRFGVKHSHSFVSFLGEPHTRFAVHSEIGSNLFKFKDIPKISDFIIKKLKSFIIRKLVYPNVHRFRLVWPRNWWPTDTQMNFMKSPPTTPKCATDLDSNPVPNTDPANCSKVIAQFERNTIKKFLPTTHVEGTLELLLPASNSTSTSTSSGTSSVQSDPKAVRRNSLSSFPQGQGNSHQSSSGTNDPLSGITVPQCLSTTVLATFSSTTDWIKTEVRRRGSLTKDHFKNLNDSTDKRDPCGSDNDNDDDNDHDNDHDRIDEGASKKRSDIIEQYNHISSGNGKNLNLKTLHLARMQPIEGVTSPISSPLASRSSLCSSPLPVHSSTPIPISDSDNAYSTSVCISPNTAISSDQDRLATRQSSNPFSMFSPSFPPFSSLKPDHSHSINIPTKLTSPPKSSHRSIDDNYIISKVNDVDDEEESPCEVLKPNEIEQQIILACEAMNKVIYKEKNEKEEQQDMEVKKRMAEEKEEEKTSVSNKWIEKLVEVSNKMQMKFDESRFNKLTPSARSRSVSEATTSSLSAISSSLNGFMTPIRETYRRHSASFAGYDCDQTSFEGKGTVSNHSSHDNDFHDEIISDDLDDIVECGAVCVDKLMSISNHSYEKDNLFSDGLEEEDNESEM